MKNKSSKILLIGLFLLGTLFTSRVSNAQADSAATVINTINQLRAQRGLAALQSHPALMQIAQQHSQYQASIGTWTHYSADGSRPRDRAEAAGFGNGATIFISENVAYGTNASILEIINGPWNDPDHHHTMYNPSAKYIGAGVAISGDKVFYTVDTGHYVGDPAPTSEYPSVSDTPSAPVDPTPVPVVVSTPLSDGSVFHIVGNGQSLWTIAAVYGIPLEELNEINQFDPDTVLVPGDKIIIEPSYTPTRTPIGEPSPTLPPRFTHTPSVMAPDGTPIHFSPTTPTPTEVERTEPRFQSSAKNPLVIILAVVISGGTMITVLIISLRKRE
jgi:LysM repeat protein